MTTHVLNLKASCTIQSSAAGPQRKFTADPAYGGGEIGGYTLQPPLRGSYVIDLASLEPRNDRLIANLDHDETKRVGHVTKIVNDGKTLSLGGIVSAATSAAKEFLESADANFPWSVSIEAALSQPKLESNVTVNGVHYSQIYVARNVKLSGVAFVSAGADSDARAIAATFSQRGNPMISANEATKIFSRVEGVQLKCGSAFSSRLSAIKERALSGEIDGLQFEREVEAIQSSDAELHDLRSSRVQAGRIDSTSRSGSPYGDVKVLSAALCLSSGMPDVEKHFDSTTLEHAYPLSRQTTLQSLLLTAAVNNGYEAGRAERIHNGNLRQVLGAAFQPSLRATGWSTVSIGDILSNVGNKNLLSGFEEMDSTWRSIARVESVKDFKEASFHRLLDDLEFEQLAPGGDIPHGTLSQEKYVGKAATYARMLTLTREDIINDDLSALSTVGRRLGRAAAQALNRLFWTKFLAADGFFAAGNNNLIDGQLDSGGVGLETALAVFRQQRSPDGDGNKLVGGNPAILLSGANTEIPARRLLNSSNVVGGTTTVGSSNPFAGLATLVVADRITDEDVGGNPDSQEWYLFRAPAYLASMIVLALNGNVQPIVESSEVDFSNLGVAFRGFSDIGVARAEKLAGLKVSGDPSS